MFALIYCCFLPVPLRMSHTCVVKMYCGTQCTTLFRLLFLSSQRSYLGENSVSAIARSCSRMALSLLVPVLIVGQRDDLDQVLSVLQCGLPGSPTTDDSQAVQFHSGVALGMLVSSFHHQSLRYQSVNLLRWLNTHKTPAFVAKLVFTSLSYVSQWCLSSEGHCTPTQLFGCSGKMCLQP